MKRQQTVLVIDDDRMVRRLVDLRLKDLSVRVESAADGPTGLAEARRLKPDLVLLDVSMPGLDGFEVCRQLRHHPSTRDIPVIFLTGSDAAGEKAKAFELGAVDYVTKPFEPGELRARVRAALRTQALVEALETQARTDSLTGLPNRAAFRRRLTECIERAHSNESYHFIVLFLDLDRFKVINDSLGHGVGDQMLIAVADTIRRVVADETVDHGINGFIARMGGDEFTILIEPTEDVRWACELAQRLRTELTLPLQLDDYQVTTDASIGVRVCNGLCYDADELIRDSDTAMYHAKALGKGRTVVFDQRMHEQALERLELEQDLRLAQAGGQLMLYYQPIISLETGELDGFEALLRWKHPQRGIISPDTFIPIAEETGLIIDIGQWVLDQACADLADWKERFPEHKSIHIGCNLSKVQLAVNGLDNIVADTLKQHGIDPAELHLEVTESVIMHDASVVVPVMDRLRDMGIVMCMDDFGKGYSSLASLHRFPIDVLKIDREFIAAMTQSRAHMAVVHAIVTLADNLGMRVVAEGIETEGHLVQLQTLECAYGQGYLFGRPGPAEQVIKWLADGVNLDACRKPQAV